VLYQLSYSHHALTAERESDPAMIAILRPQPSSGLRRLAGTRRASGPVRQTQPIGRSTVTCAATAFAASTSSPGPGTKTVRR
jgi:hypothetical protein